MRCSKRLVLGVMLAGLAGAPRPAAADITAFLGFSPTSATRSARGVAVGGGFLIVGFEFEYSDITEDLTDAAPSLRTGMFNVLLQTPIPIAGMQFYGTGGGGIFREQLGVLSETNVGTNVGGGVKLRLAGPIRARFDYRVFRLRGTTLNNTYQRFYAGLNLSF